MSEKLSSTLPPDDGRKTPAPSNAPVAKNQPAAKNSDVAGVPAAKSMPLFGGHRGGSKKRADGLVAGSPEAKEADRIKDAERKKKERAEAKSKAIPPPLPPVANPPANPVAEVATGSSAVPVPAAGPVPAAVPAAAPLFVAWTEKVLARPIKLLTRIIDRIRCSSLMQRVKKLGLTKAQEAEIEKDIQYKEEVVNDFNTALTTCVTHELNKRNVPGAEHSHWLDVLMTGGELAMIHLNTVDKLEKMIAANASAKTAEPEKSNG